MNSDGGEAARTASARRDGALLEVEVGRLIHALAPYGVLRRDALARACGARRWRAGQFRSALEAAVESGRLRQLPLGFYASATRTQGEPRGRS